MNRERLEWLALIAIASLMGLGWIVVSRDPNPSQGFYPVEEAPFVGNLAPDFTLNTISGEAITLRDFTADGGQPVVVNFWATWCPPCRVEMPYFQRVSEKYDGRVGVLSINQAESPETIAEFAERYGLSYDLLIDQDMRVNNLYGVLNLPTTLFIDRNGVVREVLIGTISQAVLEDRIEDLLDS